MRLYAKSGLSYISGAVFPDAKNRVTSIVTHLIGEWKLEINYKIYKTAWKNPNTFILTHCCGIVISRGEVSTTHFWVFCVRFPAFQNVIPLISHRCVARETMEFYVFSLAGERSALWNSTIITHLFSYFRIDLCYDHSQQPRSYL